MGIPTIERLQRKSIKLRWQALKASFKRKLQMQVSNENFKCKLQLQSTSAL